MIYVLPTRQPPRLASSRNRSTSSPLNKDATEIEPCKIRGTTQPLVSRTGAGRQGNIFSFRSREKNVLDKNSFKRVSPRPGVQVWRLFFGVTGFVVGGIFPHSTPSLCPHMLDRTSACDRQVGRVD